MLWPLPRNFACGRFLTDDNRNAIACPHLPEMEQDVYLLWLVATTALTPAFGQIVELSNPLIPIFRQA